LVRKVFVLADTRASLLILQLLYSLLKILVLLHYLAFAKCVETRWFLAKPSSRRYYIKNSDSQRHNWGRSYYQEYIDGSFLDFKICDDMIYLGRVSVEQ